VSYFFDPNIGLVGLYNSVQGLLFVGLYHAHRLADAVREIPHGLVGTSPVALQLKSARTLLRVDDERNRREPFV
jgi:hypothetical protein